MAGDTVKQCLSIHGAPDPAVPPPEGAAPARRTLNVWPDAARVLGVSRGTAYALAKSGALPTIKLGRRLLVPVARLDELLGERKP